MSKTIAERQHIQAVAEMPCIVSGMFPVQVHHALTGFGGRRNHMKVLPLHFDYHQGKHGIHTLGRKKWQNLYGTEQDLLERIAAECPCPSCKRGRA